MIRGGKTLKNYAFLNNSFLDISIYQYGYEKCIPYHAFGPGIRRHYLIHFIISGKGIYKTHLNSGEVDKEYTLHTGQAFLIEPNTIVHYYADDKDPWEYMWIEFDGIKAKEYLKQSGLTRSTPIYHPISEEGKNQVYHFLDAIINQPDLLPSETMGYIYLFFSALIKSSHRSKKLPRNNIQDFYMQSTVDFIEQFYMKDITVEDMARNLNLNRSYFSKIFKKATQKSPQSFLIQYRIHKSCELLLSTNMTVSEIAPLVGYSNQFHFARSFKNVMGISPHEYRKRNII